MMTFIERRLPHIAACVIFSAISFNFFAAFFKEAPSAIFLAVDAQVPKDDTFELFYQTDDIHNFAAGASSQVKVKGSPNDQKIIFNLPDTIRPTKIRIDIGDQLDPIEGEERIWIRRITLANSNAEYSFSGDSLVSFFHPIWVDAVGEDGLITTKRYGNTYDPALESDSVASIVDKLMEPRTVVLPPLLLSLLVFVISMYLVLRYIPGLTIPWPLVLKTGFILIFLILVSAPFAAKFLNLYNAQTSMEKRQLVSMPEFSMTKAFAREFEKYYNDNFGLRDYLISSASFLKVNIFRTPINPEKVMIGKKNWLFYNNSDGSDFIFKSYTHLNNLDAETLKSLVKTLEERKEQCRKAGITYLTGFWPQTHTIYPENLPYLMKIQISDHPSRADQVIQYLKETESSVKLIDVRPALFEKKKSARIYFKLDTHWNELGAFAGYQSFLEQCYDDIGVRPTSLDEYEVTWHSAKSGDLTDILGLRNPSVLRDTTPSLKYKGELPFEFISADGYPNDTKITKCESCADKRTLMVFGDSYFGSLRKYFSMHFYKVIYLATPYDQKSVDQYPCSIVIEAPVERYLWYWLE